MGFKTGSHGKVYNDDKKSHGSKSNSPGSNDGSIQTQKEWLDEIKENVAKDETFEGVMSRIESDWESALNEDEEIETTSINDDWKVSITHTGSWGSANEEHFSLIATNKNLDAHIEVNETLSNDDWIPEYDDDGNDNEKYIEKIQNDDKFAEKEYTKWLKNTFENYEDSMYSSLADSVQEQYPNKRN